MSDAAAKFPPHIQALLGQMEPKDRESCIQFAMELEAMIKMVLSGASRQIGSLTDQLKEAKAGGVASYNEAFNAGVEAAIATARSHDHPEQLVSDLARAKRV